MKIKNKIILIVLFSSAALFFSNFSVLAQTTNESGMTPPNNCGTGYILQGDACVPTTSTSSECNANNNGASCTLYPAFNGSSNGICSQGYCVPPGNSDSTGQQGSTNLSNQNQSSTASGMLDIPSNTGLPDPSTGAKGVLINLTYWLLGIIGIIALIAFIISGIQYFMVAGDEKNVQTAKRTMTYAIIGIIVALSGFVIIQAVDTALRAQGLF